MEQRESGAQGTGKTGGAEDRGECPQPGRATEPESEVLRWEELRWGAFPRLCRQDGVWQIRGHARGGDGLSGVWRRRPRGVTGH